MTIRETSSVFEPAPALHGRLLRLAASLLHDPHDAADAVAHALAKAGPATAGSAASPALLRTAVRRFASNLRRNAWTRRRHEVAAARAEAQPSAEELVAREQLRRRVADAVIALAEPYRSTVNLVCLEEVPVAEAARRLGVAEATVRVRLHRGRQLLRQRLDADYGGRAAWAGLACPSVGAPVGVPWLVLLGGIVIHYWVAAAAVLLVASAGALSWWSSSAPPQGPTSTRVAAAPGALAPQEEPTHTDAPAVERMRTDAVLASEAPALPPTRVVWDDGRPAAGLEFWTWSGELPSVARESEGRGLQRSELPPRHGRLGEDGSMSIVFTPRPATGGPLTVRAADGVFVTWTELQPVLRLPRLGVLAVALAGAPPDTTWDLFAEPMRHTAAGWRTCGEGGELVRRVTTASGEALVAVYSLRRRVEGVAATTLPVAAGVSYRVTGGSLGLTIEAPDAPTLAPGSVQLRCAGAVPTLHVRLLAAGVGVFTAPIGIAVESESLSWHCESATGEIRCNLRRGERVAVAAFADDEVFTATFTAPATGEERWDCVRGSGRRPWLLGARGEDDVTGFWWRPHGGDWQQGATCLTSKLPFLIERECRLLAYGLEPSKSDVFVLTRNGRALGGGGGESSWFPGRALPAPAGREYDAWRPGHEPGRCTAQLRLPPGGKETWVVLREWDREANGTLPPWSPTEVPEGLDVRLVLPTGGGDTVLAWPR
jgi:RNA polymerase sigma-70 factor (ECF subfamily)